MLFILSYEVLVDEINGLICLKDLMLIKPMVCVSVLFVMTGTFLK